MFQSKIKISKTLKVNSSVNEDEFLTRLNLKIVKDLKAYLNLFDLKPYGDFSKNRIGNNQLISQLQNEANIQVKGMVEVEKYTPVVISRTGSFIKTKLNKVELIFWDWNDNIEMLITFESEEFYYIDKIGSAVIYSKLSDGIHTEMIDLDDVSVSISYMSK